jgi:hypothetical protein
VKGALERKAVVDATDVEAFTGLLRVRIFWKDYFSIWAFSIQLLDLSLSRFVNLSIHSGAHERKTEGKGALDGEERGKRSAGGCLAFFFVISGAHFFH